MHRGFKNLAPLAAQAADNKKGENILLFDVSRMSSITDYMLVVSANSPPHMEAIEEAVSEAMEAAGVELLHHDGSDRGLWHVLDYGGIIVHLMHPEARDLYAIEKLFHGCPIRHWQAPAPKLKRRTKTTRSR